MNREDKIKAIEAIRGGTPARFALNPEKYRCLFQNEGDKYLVTSDWEEISKEDQEKYLPNAIIFVNVSKQFPNRLGEKII